MGVLGIELLQTTGAQKWWEPLGVFYARMTPGTEDWELIDHGTKLCKRV